MGSKKSSKRGRRKRRSANCDDIEGQNTDLDWAPRTGEQLSSNSNSIHDPTETFVVRPEPYVTTIARQRRYKTIEEMEEDCGPDSVLRAFLTASSETEDCTPAADYICSVCYNAKLSNMEREDELAGCKKIALVGEARMDDTGTILLDTPSVSLSAKDIGRMQMRPVIIPRIPPRTSAQASEAGDRLSGVSTGSQHSRRRKKMALTSSRHAVNSAGPEMGHAAAQRRVYVLPGCLYINAVSDLIPPSLARFVTDLNRRSIQGLIKSCLNHEELHLKNAIYKHLSGEICLNYFTSV